MSRVRKAAAVPLAALERFLLVAIFALYLGAIALQTLEHAYVRPLLATIHNLESAS